MREILFRGKRVGFNEWIEGYYFQSTIQGINNSVVKGFITTQKNDCIAELKPVYPETVGQYTGLTDENGKKIFEGDIVKVENTDHDWHEHDPNSYNVFAVSFDEGGFTASDYFLQNWLWFDGFHGEVIGNIYDNPELLEAKV